MVVILISKVKACYPQTLVESEELGSVELVVIMYCINLFVNTCLTVAVLTVGERYQ